MEDKEPGAAFKKETVLKLLSLYFKDDKTKVSSDAIVLMAEMLKIFVKEAAIRASKQAHTEDCDCVQVEHFEKILPQLLLDF
ncbi:centromere protein X isoform X1 [Polyodon spathula]|uniref:centromere protein X isoform X1 n=1 Tax=Polyodon spathula TaxID=7913 RepID=UPI001B7F6582|nr:centromere protein X isoform X1 [Polyodon spathula]